MTKPPVFLLFLAGESVRDPENLDWLKVYGGCLLGSTWPLLWRLEAATYRRGCSIRKIFW
jgi:hypothetical protein